VQGATDLEVPDWGERLGRRRRRSKGTVLGLRIGSRSNGGNNAGTCNKPCDNGNAVDCNTPLQLIHRQFPGQNLLIGWNRIKCIVA
jgi:hypothetical protein